MTTGPGSRPLLQSPRPPGSRSWAPFALLALGLASLGLLLGIDTLRERLLSEDFALVRATGEIEAGLATSHLWMEQYVSGDTAIKPEEIWRGIERSLALVRAMLSGDRLEEGPWRLRLTGDPALRRQAGEIDRGLRTFAAATLKRQTGYEKGDAVGPGSALDAGYDRTFRRLVAATTALRAAAERRLAFRVSLFRLGSRALLAGGLALLLVAFLGFRRFEERLQRAETVLHGRELQLVQAQRMEAAGRLAGGSRPAPGGAERILLVEDDAQVRESTLGLLESVGYGVTAVADGSQALTALEGAPEGNNILDSASGMG